MPGNHPKTAGLDHGAVETLHKSEGDKFGILMLIVSKGFQSDSVILILDPKVYLRKAGWESHINHLGRRLMAQLFTSPTSREPHGH